MNSKSNYETIEHAFNRSIFLEKVIDAIPDPVFIKNSDKQNIFANTAYEKLVGKKKSEFVGKRDDEFLEKRLAESCEILDSEAFLNNRTVESEEKIFDENENEHQILTKKTVFDLNQKEKYLVGVIRDITEIKKIQSSLIEQSKMASLGEMAAGIAHEINNPLMIIQAKSQLLQERISADQENIDVQKLISDLKSIVVNSIRIDTIMKTLRSVARNPDIDPFQFSTIKKIVTDSIEFSKVKFENNNISLKFIFADDCGDSQVQARSSEIVQVLINLLNNSCDAISQMVSPWVLINVFKKVDKLIIEVVDSGGKICPDVAEKMMQPFFTTKKMGFGTGLGLSVSKQIIVNNNGNFYYDANSVHTKFVIELKILQ